MSQTVDASVYVAALRPSDINHAASADFLGVRESAGEEAIIPTLILPECAGAIGRAAGDSGVGRRAAATIRSLANHTFIPLTAERAERASQLAADYRLRGADSVYVAVAQEFDATLITWDNEMLARAPAVASTMTPADWLAANP